MNQDDTHSISLDELKQRLNTDFQKGLDSSQVETQRKIYGENKLTEQKKDSVLIKIIKAQRNKYSIIFWICSIISFIVYGTNPSDISNLLIGLFIIIVILTTSTVAIKQNDQSDKLIKSSKTQPKYKVRRDNKDVEIDVTHLVVGDIIYLTTSMKIPADIRVLECVHLMVNNSCLTGETMSPPCTDYSTHKEKFQSTNVIFSSTSVTEGSGKGVVINVGNDTFIGQLAVLTVQMDQSSNRLIKTIDVFLIVACLLGLLSFMLSYLFMRQSVQESITIAVCLLIAHIPVSLVMNYNISNKLLIQNLIKKNVLIQNQYINDIIGDISCICADKTGTITQNKMRVNHLWYNDTIYRNKDTITLENDNAIEYDATTSTFKDLQKCALVSNEATFDLTQFTDKKNIDYENCPAIGDASNTGLIRFFQQTEDVQEFRGKLKIPTNEDGTLAKLPFTSTSKVNLTISEEYNENSYYTVYVKGAPEKVWSFCSSILINNQKISIDSAWEEKFNKTIRSFGDRGERTLGFAKLCLPEVEFPKGSSFKLYSIQDVPFKLASFQFCGLITLNDSPRKGAPEAILQTNSIGIKTIMVTGDHFATATNISRQVNIIPNNVKTNIEMREEQMDDKAIEPQAIVINGNDMNERQQGQDGMNEWLRKPYVVFSRVTPYQKYEIIQSCQRNDQVVAAIGDGMNDQVMLRLADVGIQINQKGAEGINENADILILDNNYHSIVSIIKEGQQKQDNLKRAICYILSSNFTEIIPILAFVTLQLPLPISAFQILAFSFVVDILSATSLAYTESGVGSLRQSIKNKTKNKYLTDFKSLISNILKVGLISCVAGFIGYFSTFHYFGFPVKSLFGLASVQGYRPPLNDFNSHINPQTNNFDSYFNQNLFDIAPDCTLPSNKIDELKYDIDWFNLEQSKFDLRKSLLKCDPLTKRWIPALDWSICDVEKSQNRSLLTHQTVCYSTDALRWAQTSFFVCIIFISWVRLLVSQGRTTSFDSLKFNIVSIVSILFQVSMIIILLYIPFFQENFGGRPINFLMIGLNQINF